MQQVTLSALTALISSSERVRVIKNGAVVFTDWGYYIKEHYKEICNFRGLRGVSVQ